MPDPGYTMPEGVHAIPRSQLDLRRDMEIDYDIMNPRPVSSDKNVWFFWHSGFAEMHSYSKRNVRTWHRRLSKQGWIIRVLDRSPGSASNVSNFLDVSDPKLFPRSFIDGTLGGTYVPQHSSDLVRFPLLLKYGGVYADVGMLQIGDLDRLWNNTIGNPDSNWEIISYNMGNMGSLLLTNYFLCSARQNPFFERCHRLLLALWAEDGGKTTTDGMHASPLLKEVQCLPCQGFEWEGKSYSPAEAGVLLTDYIAQGQVIGKVMGLVDEAEGWDGLKYVKNHIYMIEFMVGSQLINGVTDWDGSEQFRLMSLKLPEAGKTEDKSQKLAREIVESCLQKSFGFKLCTGMILRILGDTLGSLWRDNDGSDDISGTYAHWLRYGIANWSQDIDPPPQILQVDQPTKIGALLSV